MKTMAALLVLLLLFSGCQRIIKPTDYIKTNQVFDALDTVITVTLYGTDESKNIQLIQEAKTLCGELEEIFSRTSKTSELFQINQEKAGSYEVSEHLATVIQRSLYFAELSENSFDPTIGAVSSLWNFKQDNPMLPSLAAIEEALQYVDYKNISIENRIFTKKFDEITLDLGAIAKGYVGDMLKEFFEKYGVPMGMISLGGDVITFGEKPDGRPWLMGIGNPNKEEGGHIATLSMNHGAVVTSGNYQRFFQQDGRTYHHILDPTTGYPVDNDVVSVTVWAENGMDADGLSTICFVLGIEKGIEFLKKNGVAYAVFYDSDGNFYTTKNISGFTPIKK